MPIDDAEAGSRAKAASHPSGPAPDPAPPTPNPLARPSDKKDSNQWLGPILPTGDPLTPPPPPACPNHSHQPQNAGKNGRTCPRGLPRPLNAKCDRHICHLPTQPRQEGLVSSPLTLNHGQTMPHLGAMTSSRLGKGPDSSNGT